MTKSVLEHELARQILLVRCAVPEREYRFHPTRKWRFDFAWPDSKVAAEVEGATWANGRHTRGSGVELDCEKYAEANLLGWHVYRFTGKMVSDGRAIDYIERALTVTA